MAVNIRRDLLVRYELISKSIGDIEKKLDSLPQGRITVRTRGDKSYFYLDGTENENKYLGPGNDLIEKLIQKDYLKKVLKEARQELQAIEKMLKIYPDTRAEDVFAMLTESRKMFASPINICDDSYAAKWMETPYKHKPFKKDAPVFKTLKNERVRSKSEVIIADRLREKGIPYRYECPLKIGNKVIHPDFTILRMSDRRILYHEHCGKMGDPVYTEDLITRAKDYNKAGIILGDRLFYTFESETTPLDMTLLDNIIDQHYR